jgi:predicted nucleotidyltransferase
MKQSAILQHLRQLKPFYEKEGIVLVGLFGSHAREKAKPYSDIDIAYRIDRDTFSQKYVGGFAKLLRIEEIRNNLKKHFNTPVDLVPDTNTKTVQGLIRV